MGWWREFTLTGWIGRRFVACVFFLYRFCVNAGPTTIPWVCGRLCGHQLCSMPPPPPPHTWQCSILGLPSKSVLTRVVTFWAIFANCASDDDVVSGEWKLKTKSEQRGQLARPLDSGKTLSGGILISLMEVVVSVAMG